MTTNNDIFHSEPEPGAIITDATGPDAVLVLDITNAFDEHYHFEIHNDDKPKQLPAGTVIGIGDLKRSNVIEISVAK